MRKPVPISFATYGEGSSWGAVDGPYAGHASVDLSNGEVAEIIARLPRGPTGIEVTDTAMMYDLLQELDGRFLVGLHTRRHLVERTVEWVVFGSTWTIADDLEHPGIKLRLREPLSELLEEHFTSTVATIERALATQDPLTILTACGTRPQDDEEVAAFIDAHAGRIVGRIHGMSMVSFSQAVDLDAVDQASWTLHSHRDAWGRRHRLISTSCVDLPAYSAITIPQFDRQSFAPDLSATAGHWEAWRGSGPIAFRSIDEQPGLQLAELLARATAEVKSHWVEKRSYASQIKRNYLGDIPLVEPESEAVDDSESLSEDGKRYSRYVATGSESTLEDGHPDALLVARGIRGTGVREARDRLLLKMTGRGLGAGTILPMRIETLEVNQSFDLIDQSLNSTTKVMRMDGGDLNDFWTLVRVNESLEGFLFSSADNDAAYGLCELSPKDLEAIFAERKAAAAFPDIALPFDLGLRVISDSHPISGQERASLPTSKFSQRRFEIVGKPRA